LVVSKPLRKTTTTQKGTNWNSTTLGKGCDRAESGSCSVHIDGIPHYSCSVLTHTVRGRKVLTIEGLADDDGTLHPVLTASVVFHIIHASFLMDFWRSGPTALTCGMRGEE
jgi:aerobic-type carbon monoxide dehydrogenase small subunit (CoxS/CutS family)